MTRLIRPPIPVEVKCRVVLRQLGEMFIDEVIRLNRYVPRESVHRRSLGKLLVEKLAALAEALRCEISDLDLDHDPPLGARQKVFNNGVHVDYDPPANDPNHLIYRIRDLHKLKTNVRGENGQHPDRVLIKKNRRLERQEAGTKPKRARAKIKGLTFQQLSCRLGARCHCNRRKRKTCRHYRNRKRRENHGT